MSTEYQFSDLKLTEKSRRFNDAVQHIRNQCIKKVHDLTDDPELENAKEFILDNLQYHNPFVRATWMRRLLSYNNPVAYAELILNGEPEIYLKTVTEYKPIDS